MTLDCMQGARKRLCHESQEAKQKKLNRVCEGDDTSNY